MLIGHSQISNEIGAVVNFVNFVEFKGCLGGDEQSLGSFVESHSQLLSLVVGVGVVSFRGVSEILSVHDDNVLDIVVLGTSLSVLDLEIEGSGLVDDVVVFELLIRDFGS